MDKLARYAAHLEELTQLQLRRQLRPAAGFDFASNDYLALSNSPRLRRAQIDALQGGIASGSGGSRLLRGNHPEHMALEAAAARFFHCERALLFGSGYAANMALLATLPQRDDLVVYDELVHASAHDGMKLGRAHTVSFLHNDVDAAESRIREWRDTGGLGTPWIVVESLYSMEGDRAPLDDIRLLADRTDAFIMIDEAHATGVFGADGRGLAVGLEGRDNVIVLHTGGKALGASGALVTGPSVLCEFLVNRARPFIFATAPSPLVAVTLGESLRILTAEPGRRERLLALTQRARTELHARLGISTSDSQILPIIIGQSGPALRMADELRQRGFDVRAIRPPTVPAGTARLRVSITLQVDEEAIDGLVDALEAARGAGGLAGSS